MSAPNLRDKTVKGLGWSTIDSVAAQGISFVVGIILARLLSPTEFGTIGIAMIFVALFNRIINCGFSSALIRKQDVKDVDYSTTFVYNLIVSGLLYVVCFFCSPYIAIFFHNEALTSVVRWISLSLIINAFSIVQYTRLVKGIDFKTQAKISIIASLFSGVVGIAMAYSGWGVWSLVGQQLSRQFCNTVFLWFFNKWVPSLRFSKSSFRELFSYGSKLMLSGIIDTLFGELTTIFVGKIYTPATLGQYSRAKQFGGIFSSNLSAVMGRVTYPVLSEIQNDKVLLIAKYRQIIRTLMLVTGIGLAFMASTANSVILMLIGPKWMEAIPYLQLLAFVEVTIPLKNVNLNLLQIYGRSDYILILSIIKRIIELCAICLGFISINWMLIGFAIAGVIGFLLNACFTMKVSGYTVFNQMKDIFPSFVISVTVGLIMFSISFYVANIFLCFTLQVLIGLLLFVLISEHFKLEEYKFLKTLIREYCVNPLKNKLKK